MEVGYVFPLKIGSDMEDEIQLLVAYRKTLTNMINTGKEGFTVYAINTAKTELYTAKRGRQRLGR